MSAPSITYLQREQVERLAQEIAVFLEDRTFAKNPHIGLIGPGAGTRGAETDPLELLSSSIEELTEQWLSPFVCGFRVELSSTDTTNRSIKVCYSFYLRIAPPDTSSGQAYDQREQFRAVDLCLLILDESRAEVSITAYDGQRQTTIYSKSVEIDDISNGISVSFPSGNFADLVSTVTTLTDLGYGSRRCQGLRFVYGFSLLASISHTRPGSIELAVRLVDGEGHFIDVNHDDRAVPISEENRRCRHQGMVDSRNEAWSTGQLHEVQSVLRVTGYDFSIRITPRGIAGLRPINCAYNLEASREGVITFRDYAIVSERGLLIRQSVRHLSEFLNSAVIEYGRHIGMSEGECESIARLVSDAITPLLRESDRLYTFQEDCCSKVLSALVEDRGTCSAVPIGVQTAGGKTLGFLIPVGIYAFTSKIRDGSGVKVLLFYPTRALINDQSDTIVRFLWNLNEALRENAPNYPPVTFGILHGEIKYKGEKSRDLSRDSAVELPPEPMRLKCPECSSSMQITYRRVGEQGVAERITCSNTGCRLSSDVQAVTAFNQAIRYTRDSIFADPPDILVCTPDIINLRLFYNPSEQSIFGRRIKRCRTCGHTSANLRERGPCPRCGGDLDSPERFTVPRVFVFDEAHQLRGSFGSQVSHLVSRLEQAARTISSAEFRPVYIFSSATLATPEQFVQDFFGVPVNTKELVRAQYVDEAEIINRVHLFMVPKGYSPEATLVQSVRAVFRNFPLPRYPNILIFVNSLAESNELIHQLRNHQETLRRQGMPPPAINGHSTDYGNEQRQEVEDSFTRGEINVLVATTTLQVGVDFDRIDALFVYGAPFYLSDYVQRMGRAGRNHPAVVISILPNKPIDFFFFSNYPIITSTEVREQALNSEHVRISRENETIRKRSAVRAFLDYLCTRQEAPLYYQDSPRGIMSLLRVMFSQNYLSNVTDPADVLRQAPRIQDLNNDLIAYIEQAMRTTLTDDERQGVLRTVDDILERMTSRGITNIAAVLSSRGFLDSIYAMDLRQSDYIVRIEHPDLQTIRREWERERSLAIAIGDYAPGQITSYQSLFFVVDRIETDPTQGSIVRNAVYGQPASMRRADL